MMGGSILFSIGFRLANVADSTPSGDFNGDGAIDAADYVVWRSTLGSTYDMRANGDNSGASAHVIDQADYEMWRAHFDQAAGSSGGVIGSASASAAIPERATLWLIGLGIVLLMALNRNKCTTTTCGV
jgi:hypothetical protein